MIIDKETNFVYFSELLSTDCRFEEAYLKIKYLLEKHGIQNDLLKGTKDIWCRDYMPVQILENQFVQFRYEPSYLKEYLHLQSIPKEVLAHNDLQAGYSDINLDGGNVLRWTDRAIITDRIFKENPAYPDKSKLLKQIEKQLQAEVIVIPAIKSDMTGHADGLVRFYDRTTVIGNRLQDEYLYWQKGMKKVIADFNLDYVELPSFDYKYKKNSFSAVGCYVNYLEIGNLIIAPVFEVEGNKDSEVISILEEVFCDRIVEVININEIAALGGLLNCISWNMKAAN